MLPVVYPGGIFEGCSPLGLWRKKKEKERKKKERKGEKKEKEKKKMEDKEEIKYWRKKKRNLGKRKVFKRGPIIRQRSY